MDYANSWLEREGLSEYDGIRIFMLLFASYMKAPVSEGWGCLGLFRAVNTCSGAKPGINIPQNFVYKVLLYTRTRLFQTKSNSPL